MKWTEAQQQAIEAPKPGPLATQSLLVAAAAGSGKTAVLVERIMQRLQDTERPLAVNELLVLTFTKAAAEEMKTRIGSKLAEVYEKTQNPYLEEQLNLLPSAQISTLHSFCQWVIRNYFYELNMDPTARVGNQGQMELLKGEVLEALLQEAYEKNEHHIYALADMFSEKGSDRHLKNIILTLYHFSKAMENPEQWLANLARPTAVFGRALAKEVTTEKAPDAEAGILQHTPWGAYFWEAYRHSVATVGTELKAIEALVEHLENPNRDKPIQEIRSMYHELHWAKTWDEGASALRRRPSRWTSLRVPKDATVDGELLSKIDGKIRHCRELIKNLCETSPLLISSEAWERQLASQQEIIEGLASVTQAFSEAFQAKKQAEGLLDFNDLEHYCLALLTDSITEDGIRQPSKVALELQKTFAEVMLDEYQDTNGVQEAIVNLVSRGDNCFYVGDVKQSIYRFRMADPGLFMEKYKRFGRTLDSTQRRIDLAQNFRSHENILAATNFIFSQIMTEEAAELAYGDEEALHPGRILEEVPERYVGGPVEILVIEKQKPQEEASLTGADLEGGRTEEGTTTEDEEQAQILAETSEVEAEQIAKEILRLRETGAQVQDKNGTFREIRWSDIVILSRSIKGVGNRVVSMLRRYEIPAYVSEKSGYFQSMEVQLLLCMLQSIDNPEQDLAMASVLRSPLVGMDSNTLAALRVFGREAFAGDSTLWQAQKAYVAVARYVAEGTTDGAILSQEECERLRPFLTLPPDAEMLVSDFVSQLESWRTFSRRRSVSDLIWKVLADTDYVSYVSAMQQGSLRRANVLALYDRAKEYEAGNFRGLFRFLRFLESLRESGEDLAIAQTIGEGDDVVRIMSIHQSKGLEFPVVFLMSANKSFNTADTKTPVLLHKEGGIGIKGYFPQYRVMYPSLTWLYVKEQVELASKAEEERILYVALTRAKDKLYIVGTISQSGLAEYCKPFAAAIACESQTLPRDSILGCKSYLAWLLMAVSRHLHGGIIRNALEMEMERTEPLQYGKSQWQLRYVVVPPTPIDTTTATKKTVQTYLQAYQQGLLEESEDGFYTIHEATAPAEQPTQTSALPSFLQQRLSYVYPFAGAVETAAKTSVSEIKRRFMPEEEEAVSLHEPHLYEAEEHPDTEPNPLPLTGAFAKEPSWEHRDTSVPLKGAAYGTAMHSAMEWLPLVAYTASSLREALDRLVLTGHLTEEERKAVNETALLNFFKSSLGERVLASPTVKKEFSFSVLIEGKPYYPSLETGEKVFLQGIMDLLFWEQDGWVLVDYKTDRVRTADTLWARYAIQLELYAKALTQLTGKPVREIYIYSFALGKALQKLRT